MGNPDLTDNSSISSSVQRIIKNGVPRGIRTPDPKLRRLVLYPTELWARTCRNP